MRRIVELPKLHDFVQAVHILIGIGSLGLRLLFPMQRLFVRIFRFHLKCFSIISIEYRIEYSGAKLMRSQFKIDVTYAFMSCPLLLINDWRILNQNEVLLDRHILLRESGPFRFPEYDVMVLVELVLPAFAVALQVKLGRVSVIMPSRGLTTRRISAVLLAALATRPVSKIRIGHYLIILQLLMRLMLVLVPPQAPLRVHELLAIRLRVLVSELGRQRGLLQVLLAVAVHV